MISAPFSIKLAHFKNEYIVFAEFIPYTRHCGDLPALFYLILTIKK